MEGCGLGASFPACLDEIVLCLLPHEIGVPRVLYKDNKLQVVPKWVPPPHTPGPPMLYSRSGVEAGRKGGSEPVVPGWGGYSRSAGQAQAWALRPACRFGLQLACAYRYCITCIDSLR